MFRICLISCVVITSSLFAQRPKSYSIVTRQLTDKILATTNQEKPLHLAVAPLAATSVSLQNSKAFGEYLTETIVGSLSGYPTKLKLFERTRMDAILKEQEFILTDLMKPAAALKIGQLAPIDAILSGTYTKLKSYVDVSVRVIDVSTGEISVSFTGRIKLDKNLKSLFESNQPTSQPATTTSSTPVQVTINNNISTGSTTDSDGKTKETQCKEMVDQFRIRLNDLSTPEKISEVVRESMRTPFDNQCGKLHYLVMSSFSRYKIDPPDYNAFLRKTLDTIAYPTGDERAYEIIQYFAMPGQVDGNEWNSALICISRVGNYSLSTYLNYLLAKPNDPVDERKRRIDTYFGMAKNQKIGLPRPISYEVAFVEMMEGLKSHQPLRKYVYENYARRLKPDEKLMPTLFNELASLYKDETESTEKSKVIEWISTFTNTNEYAKAPDQLYDFAYQFNLTSYEERNKEIRAVYPENDLTRLIDLCRSRFSSYATKSQYSSQTEDRVKFCARHGIEVPGMIPTISESESILKGTNLDEQFRTMKLLVLMNERALPLEPHLINLLSKRSLEDRSKLQEIQTLAIEVLGNCRTRSTTAIEFMLDALPHYGNDTEAAKEALVKIGKAAVTPIAARLDKTTEQDGGLQYQLITLLGKIGKDAAPAQKSIKRVLALTRNADVKYAAEAALQLIP